MEKLVIVSVLPCNQEDESETQNRRKYAYANKRAMKALERPPELYLDNTVMLEKLSKIDIY